MSVLGAMSRKDKGAAPVLPNVETPPETTGFFQNVGAGFEQAKAGPHSTQNARAIYESRYYDQIVQALAAEGEKATDYVESPVLPTSPFYRPVPGEQIRGGKVYVPVQRGFANPFSEGPSLTRDVNPIGNLYLGGDAREMGGIWDAVKRVRQRKPDFLKAFPDASAIDALAMRQRQGDLAHAQGVTSRATTAGQLGAFIGGAAGSVLSGDPENFVGGFAGAPGKSVARTVVKRAVEGAAANAAAGIVGIPGQSTDAERMGQSMTAGDMAESVGQNALVGAVFGTAHVAIPKAVGAGAKAAGAVAGKVAEHLPASIRDPIVAASIRAGTVRDRELLYEFQRAHSPYSIADTSTPTEKAAAHTIVRDVETQEQSPLRPEHAPANNNRLGAISKALGVDLTPPEVPTPAPVPTPTVRDREGGGRKPASFVDGINAAEGHTRNPRSSADGYGNFIDSTWLAVAPKVTDTAGLSRDQILQLRHDKTIAAKATNYYAAMNSRYLRIRGLEDSPGNLSLAHFLGPEGAAKVLKADPSTPVESILPAEVIHANREVLKGKSADQVVAWAHKRIGAAVDYPPARPDAVPSEGYDYASPVPYTVENVASDQVTTNAALMQYKSGGDENGVTDALKGVEQWNPLMSQQILLWEPETGGRIVVDGHQRVGLARRLSERGDRIELPAIVVKEADGISAEQARVLGALRNIANGTGTLLDNAKVLRDAPEASSLLPRNAPLARDAMGLAHLSYEAFGAAANEVVPPHIAAQVGMNAPHAPEAHLPILGLLAKERITDPREAAQITRQAVADGFGTADAEQLSLLGAEPQQSLYVPISRIMAAAAKRLREEKRTFKVLTEKAGKIESAGNVLDRTANESKVISNEEALAILDRTAHSAGPVRDALVRAARSELSGVRRADAVGQFLDELGSIDLRAAAAGLGSDGSFSEPSGGAGRDLATEASFDDLPPGSEPSLFDRAVAAREAGEPFSDPASSEAKQQTALLEHDLRPPKEEVAPESEETKPPPVVDDVHLFDLPGTGFRLSDEGEKPVSLKQALDDADAADAAAKALRDCL
jgi:hypothetical protein